MLNCVHHKINTKSLTDLAPHNNCLVHWLLHFMVNKCMKYTNKQVCL